MAVMKLDIKVYVVICSSEPPSFCVTTAAAAAQGEMTHISIASIRMRLSPVIVKPSISPMSTPMNISWNTLTQRCHVTGRSLWKSTLQNVTKRIKNINIGRMASKIGSKNIAASSSCGVKAKMRYSNAPVLIDTGNVQSLINLMVLSFIIYPLSFII